MKYENTSYKCSCLNGNNKYTHTQQHSPIGGMIINYFIIHIHFNSIVLLLCLVLWQTLQYTCTHRTHKLYRCNFFFVRLLFELLGASEWNYYHYYHFRDVVLKRMFLVFLVHRVTQFYYVKYSNPFNWYAITGHPIHFKIDFIPRERAVINQLIDIFVSRLKFQKCPFSVFNKC